MPTYRWRRLLACALGLLLLSLPAAAQASRGGPLPVGDPIENDTWWLRPIEGSFRLEAARAADPDGGPVWAIGTLRARIELFPPEAPDATCMVLGRVQDGQLGMPTERGLFRPFALGAGAVFCSTTPEERRWPTTGVRSMTSVLLDERCVPRRFPEEPIPECDPALVRTAHFALLGPGSFRAWAPDADGRFRPAPIESDGSLLFVENVQRERLLVPVVSFRVCGAGSRPDLVDFGVWGTVRGCLMTMTIVPLFWAMAQEAGAATPPGAAAQGGCAHVHAGRSAGSGRTIAVCTAQAGG